MADDTPERSPQAAQPHEPARPQPQQPQQKTDPPEGPSPTPFDHPLFLPALLLAGMVWFGYDGWLNTRPEMLEHQHFNRIGFAVLTVAALWFGIRGVREYREERRSRPEADRPEHSD